MRNLLFLSVSFYVMYLFLIDFQIFFSSLVLSNLIMLCLGAKLCFLCLGFVGSVGLVFIRFGKFLFTISSNILCPFSCSSHETDIVPKLVHCMLSHRSLRLCALLFNLLSFCFSINNFNFLASSLLTLLHSQISL